MTGASGKPDRAAGLRPQPPTASSLSSIPCAVIGRATLYNADCRDVLPLLGTIDAVVTDPPYGIGHIHSGKANGKWNVANRSPIFMDDEPFDPRPFIIGKTIMFGADHFAPLLPPGGIFHVWDKECGRTGRFDSFSDAELFWTSWTCKRRVIRYMWKGLQVECPTDEPKREHPTQKPIAVMRQILDMLPDAQSVLDPFMGSGTTGVAAVRMGRDFVGIEKDEKHFFTACKRIDDAQRQGDFFVEAA
jgi:site-specific DNA-methyltransferase (adenine-specific)